MNGILKDHREPRDWRRPWRDPPGLICCCTSTKILVVVSFGRHLFAYDGSGTQVWTYDLGQHSAHDYIGGKPIIDSSGNTYIVEKESVNNNSDTNLLKIDKTGTLVWTYAVGNSFSVYAATNRESVCGACFDSSGNIVFGTGLVGTAGPFNYAHKVNTSGSLVQEYSTHNTGFPAGLNDLNLFNGANASAVDCIALDSSDNVFWIDANSHNRLIQVNSTGTYQSSVLINGLNGTTSSEHGRSIVADKTNAKLFIGFAADKNAGAPYDTKTYLAGRWDIAGMSNDWVLDLTHWSGIDLTNSVLEQLGTVVDACGRGIGFDPNTSKVYVGGGYLVNASDVLEQVIAIGSGASAVLKWSGIVDLALHTVVGCAACVEPTTGDVFAIADTSSTSGVKSVWRLDSVLGTTIWSVNSSVSPLAIGCGSYS